MTESHVIGPSRTWLRRALIFSSCYLSLALLGGYFVPWVLLLAPFALYDIVYAVRALQPGGLEIELQEEQLIARAPFRRELVIKRSEVARFLAVYRGTTEFVVARGDDAIQEGSNGRVLFRSGDRKLPCGLMKNPELARKLEGWRLGRPFSVRPPAVQQQADGADESLA